MESNHSRSAKLSVVVWRILAKTQHKRANLIQEQVSKVDMCLVRRFKNKIKDLNYA